MKQSQVCLLLACILGLGALKVSAEFCDCAGTQTTSAWLVQCYGLNSSTIYELKSVLRYIQVKHHSKEIMMDISLSVGEDFPDDIFLGYKIISLAMTNCNFTELPYGLLSNMPIYLGYLEFSDNSISTIDKERFNQLPFVNGLRTLNLQNNRIESLPEDAFVNLTSLDSLSLQYNLLETLAGNTFRGLSTLKTLYLHQNALVSLETSTFFPLKNLHFVSLELNQITFLDNGTFSAENQPKLSEIPLEGKI